MQQPMLDAPTAEWLVYGDALQVAGDPRGELIGLVHAVSEGRATVAERDAHVARHAEALLGAAGKWLDQYRLEWRHCLLDRIEIHVKSGNDGRKVVETILRAEIASDVREVALVGLGEPDKPVDLTRAMAMLASCMPPSLRSFVFVDELAANANMLVAGFFEPEANLVSFGSFAPFFAVAEEVRIVTADSHQLDLANIDAPFLKRFTLESLRFGDYEDGTTMSGRLAAAKWPVLESFACRLVETWGANIPLEDKPYVSIYTTRWTERDSSHDRYEEAELGESQGVDWNVLDQVLANLSKAPLRRLALTSFQSTDTLLQVLAGAGLPEGLELDLSDSALVMRDLDALLGMPALLRPIRKLVIHRVALTDAELATCVARFERKGVFVEGSGGGGRDARYRFVIGQE